MNMYSMSFGRDAAWRSFTVNKARLKPGGLALDVATGTGRIAQEMAQRGTKSVGIDFCAPMMVQGRSEGVGVNEPVFFAGADALSLPFDDNTFDCFTTGSCYKECHRYREGAFREMCRVVKPGGRIVCMEVGKPRFAVTRLFHGFYTHRVIPLVGKLIAGDSDAYTYLPSSMGKSPSTRGTGAYHEEGRRTARRVEAVNFRGGGCALGNKVRCCVISGY